MRNAIAVSIIFLRYWKLECIVVVIIIIIIIIPLMYRGADKSLVRPTSLYILFDG
jgi:hypothetical protein